jgi:Ca2+-binding RTX toxin-like protein
VTGPIRVDPDALDVAGDAVAQMVGDLRAQTRGLGAALDAFRSTIGWTEFMSDVPPLDIDLGAEGGLLDLLGSWLGQVAGAFRALDGEGGSIFTRAIRAGLLEALLGGVLPTPDAPALVFDGERWVLLGTSASDSIEVVMVDGQMVARVRTLDSRTGALGEVTEYVLTEEQANGLVIRAGSGNDIIAVDPDIDVELVIWAGSGDDLVGWADQNPAVRISGGSGLRIFLGDGDDVAYGSIGADEIYTGAGTNFVDGGDGDDRIVAGGSALDVNVLYGGSGDDLLIGGRGRSYLEGGSGADTLHGIAGSNVLSGGRGDDRIIGGVGADTIIGGRGADRITTGDGSNVVYTDGADDISGRRRTVRVEVDGEPGSLAIATPRPDWMSEAEHRAFLERMDADLELLRHLPDGQAGLSALDDVHRDSRTFPLFGPRRQIVVLPYGNPNEPHDGFSEEDWLRQGNVLGGNYAAPPGSSSASGRDAAVNYGGAHIELQRGHFRPPIVSLYHELSHSFDQLSGGTESGTYTEIYRDADGNELGRTTQPMAEINSVGFDLEGDGRIGTRPSAGGREHPTELTENTLRSALGWEPRRGYGRPPEGTVTTEIEIEP